MTNKQRLPNAEINGINGNLAETFSRRMLGDVLSRSPLGLQERESTTTLPRRNP